MFSVCVECRRFSEVWDLLVKLKPKYTLTNLLTNHLSIHINPIFILSSLAFVSTASTSVIYSECLSNYSLLFQIQILLSPGLRERETITSLSLKALNASFPTYLVVQCFSENSKDAPAKQHHTLQKVFCIQSRVDREEGCFQKVRVGVNQPDLNTIRFPFFLLCLCFSGKVIPKNPNPPAILFTYGRRQPRQQEKISKSAMSQLLKGWIVL